MPQALEQLTAAGVRYLHLARLTACACPTKATCCGSLRLRPALKRVCIGLVIAAEVATLFRCTRCLELCQDPTQQVDHGLPGHGHFGWQSGLVDLGNRGQL